MNIYEKLLTITAELTKVAKNLQVGEGKYAYKAVGEADILASVRPLEEKYKVYSYPYKRTVLETGELETKTGTKNLFLRIETIYRFVNVENPSEFVDITSYGDGVDSQDKSVGKAMTYSDKYALMKAYKIMTGEDPDQHYSEELKGKTTTKPYTRQTAQAQSTPATPALATAEQLAYLNNLDQKLKDFALKKFNVDSLTKLTYEQAKYIIDSLKKKETA